MTNWFLITGVVHMYSRLHMLKETFLGIPYWKRLTDMFREQTLGRAQEL